MKLSTALVFGAVTISTHVVQAEESKKDPDETVLIQLHQDFAIAWSKGELDKLANFFAPDAVRVGAFGDIARGPVEIRAALGKLLEGGFKGATVEVERGTVRMLNKDTALWQGSMVISTSNAKIKGYVLDIMKKVDGRWLILETHPKLFPPPKAP